MEGYLFRRVRNILDHSRVFLRSYSQVVIVGWIDIIALIKDLIVEMRAGRTSRVAAFTDTLSPLDLHSLDDSYRFKVGISGLVSETMVDDYLVAIAEKFELYALDDSISGRIDRIARLKGEVDSRMSLRAPCKRICPVSETA